MANPSTIDGILDDISGCWGFFRPEKARTLWIRSLQEVDDGPLRDAAQAWIDNPESKGPPKPSDLKAMLQTVAERAVPDCGRCASGLREVTVHRRIEGEVVIRNGWVRCDCAAGAAVDQKQETRRPRVPDLAGQVAYLQADPSVVFWWVDPLPHEREPLDVVRPPTTSAAIRHVRELVLGADPDTHARERERAVRRAGERLAVVGVGW